MNCRAVICFLLFVAVPPAPGQTSDQPTNKSGKPQGGSRGQKQPAEQISPPFAPNPVATPDTQRSRSEQKQGNNPVSISTVKPLDVRADIPKDWMDKLSWVFTAVLVLIGGAGVYAAIRTLRAIEQQARLMQQQVDDAKTSNIQTAEIASGTLRAIRTQAELMERQALVLESQSKTIQQAADAATTSADTAKQSLVITQRAFLTFVRYQTLTMFEKPNNEGAFLGFRFIIEYENAGKTPAVDAEIIFGFHKTKKGESEDIVLPTWEQREPRIPSTIAPGIKMSGIAELEPIEVDGIASGDLLVFLYTQAQYRDVFVDTPIHHSGTCVKLIKIADLMSESPFQFRLYFPKYNYGD